MLTDVTRELLVRKLCIKNCEKNKFKTFTNRILIIYRSYQLVLKFSIKFDKLSIFYYTNKRINFAFLKIESGS